MVFAPTHYFRPRTIKEAISILSKYRNSARLVGGGTMVHELAERGLLSNVEALVGIEGLDLNYIEKGERTLRIGASTTIADLLESEALGEEKCLAGLIEALSEIRPLQVRNVATIGGAICSAIPTFDLPVALVAHDCVVKIVGGRGAKSMRLEGFYKGIFETKLAAGEMVTEVRVPLKRDGSASAFTKLAVTGDDWAIVNSAVSLTMGYNGKCNDVRIAVGGGGLERAMRIRKAEATVRGKKVDDEIIIATSKRAGKAGFSDDSRASGNYRRAMCGEIVSRTLRSALRRVGA